MSNSLNDAVFWHRLQFAFTITYHYLFPQLTMGAAWFIVAWKWLAMRTGDQRYVKASGLWTRIFGLTFVVGVVTGIPMEFQFGTNWGGFSKHAGGIIGQTLAMEGMFAFFLESAFIGVLLYGEKRMSPRAQFFAALGLAVGSWLSAYFILVTNAFMQHPVGHGVAEDGTLYLADIGAYLLNPWALVEFAHNQAAARTTRSPRCTTNRPGSTSAGERASGSARRSSWPFPQATPRRRWSPAIRKWPSPRWRAALSPAPWPRSPSSANPTLRSDAWTTRSSSPAC
jgi:hypothetical protein